MTIQIDKGETIYRAVQTAKDAAVKAGHSVQFEFNGLTVTVDPESYPSDVVTIYNLLHALRRARAAYRDD